MPGKFLVQPAEGGPRLAIAGDVYTVKATGADTGGAYALLDAIVPPGGGPPPHVHSREDEAFYVLEGEITFYAEGREEVAGPGAFVHSPRGIVHRFANNSDKPARMLIQVFPAGLEEYFAEVGLPITDPTQIPDSKTPEAIGKLVALAPKYGLEIMPPPQG